MKDEIKEEILEEEEQEEKTPRGEVDLRPVGDFGVNVDTEDVLSQIACEKDPNKIKDLTYLFNQNISKKNMIRLNKLNNIMDKLSDEVANRIVYDADNIKNEDLIKFVNAIQKTMEGSEKTINGVSSQPTIQINAQTNNIALDSLGLKNKESRDKVMDIVNSILNSSSKEEELEEIEVVEEED